MNTLFISTCYTHLETDFNHWIPRRPIYFMLLGCELCYARSIGPGWLFLWFVGALSSYAAYGEICHESSLPWM